MPGLIWPNTFIRMSLSQHPQGSAAGSCGLTFLRSRSAAPVKLPIMRNESSSALRMAVPGNTKSNLPNRPEIPTGLLEPDVLPAGTSPTPGKVTVTDAASVLLAVGWPQSPPSFTLAGCRRGVTAFPGVDPVAASPPSTGRTEGFFPADRPFPPFSFLGSTPTSTPVSSGAGKGFEAAAVPAPAAAAPASASGGLRAPPFPSSHAASAASGGGCVDCCRFRRRAL